MQLAVALDGAPAPIGATTFDPYGQLVKMLLPRAQSIAIYDRVQAFDNDAAQQMSLLLVALSLAALALVFALNRRNPLQER